MSRATFNDLILSYGTACALAARSADDPESHDRETEAYAALTLALRKAGIPLGQVAK